MPLYWPHVLQFGMFGSEKGLGGFGFGRGSFSKVVRPPPPSAPSEPSLPPSLDKIRFHCLFKRKVELTLNKNDDKRQ